MNHTKKTETKRWRRWLAVALGCALVMAAGCGEDDEPRVAEYALSPAGSCDDVRDYMAESLTESALESLYSGYYYDDMGMNGAETADMDAAPAEDASDGGGGRSDDASASPSEFTDTNVQEEGVDEPDIVKTDGNYIYAIAGGSLQIVKSWPADEMELVGQYEFPQGVRPTSLFLKGDEVVVFSRMNNRSYYAPTPDGGTEETESVAQFRGTRATLIDVSDRSAPQAYRKLELEGDYVNGRMVDGKVFLVSNSRLRDLNLWQFMDEEEFEALPEPDYESTEEELEEMREEARPMLYDIVRSALDEIPSGDWLPRQRIVDGDGNEELLTALHKCEGLYLPGVSAELGILNISSFDFAEDATLETSGLIARGWEVYSSKQNLYVTMSSRSWWGWWGSDRDNESHIHKFSLENDGQPAYLASGRVDGWILNQFSMSEYKGHLRVGTTDNQWETSPWAEDAEDSGGNHLIILKREDGELVETGSIRNLAPTEQIYSARFMGDRGYMVTFFMVDPLYTFDLSDPTDPKVLGELKIDGYSSYMHPLDEDHLLAIGLDGDENGMMSGVHLQVFDVTDMTDPQRIHHHVISTGSWSSHSEAMRNHHAFTYQERLGVLGVPVSVREEGEHFSGLMLFDATVDGIEEIGRVDHSDLVAEQWCQENAADPDNCEYDPGYHRWNSRVRRSIMMSGETDSEEYVYSLSGVGLKVNETFNASNELGSVLMN